MDDYDEEGSEQKQVDAMKNSIDQLMKTQTAMEELKKELEQKGELSAAQANLANKLLSDEERSPTGTRTSPEGPRRRPTSRSKTTKRRTTSSRPLERQQKPKVASKKIDETSNDAPFDFDAFPSPPPESTAGTPTSTAPSRLQTKQTTTTTTPEPDYLVADDLSEVPESVRSHPRRKFQPARGSSIRRRPVATSPYVDEETISSPFDVGADGEKQPAKGPNGRNRKVEALPGDDAQADAFDRADNFEQPEGRFSLPETRFNQRSPFDPPGEIRRAPTPQPSRSVDIVFQTPFEEPIAMPPIAEIGHRDGERFYTPPENKPMPVPTPAVVEERAPAVEVIEANETPPPTPAYNPLHFYHTIQPRRGFLKEKVLTFCTKDSAIRDQNNMVIACGVESDVWVPNRCPAGTDCFSSNDSLYRICCPVGSR
ncbi:hypothetical protein M3Y99_00314400 [Aphelenchoides fujianensis]|nr:hypothetical protein M3Y99_00314400 [Aphelenchoides fujianensis]